MTRSPALHSNLPAHPNVRQFDRSAQREVEKPLYFSRALASLHPERTAGTSGPREARA